MVQTLKSKVSDFRTYWKIPMPGRYMPFKEIMAYAVGGMGAYLIITMASMLRIPVALHNVDDSKIFRPACWGAFGTKDLEGADFRACETYGPLYK